MTWVYIFAPPFPSFSKSWWLIEDHVSIWLCLWFSGQQVCPPNHVSLWTEQWTGTFNRKSSFLLENWLQFALENQLSYLLENLQYRRSLSNSPAFDNYTLGKKGCYIPIEDNKTNVDRTSVFSLGWNWHDMDQWLFPNEIRHYLGQTFNDRSSGIVELRNHSIGGRSPKSIFTLWQLWINICIFFLNFFWLNNAPSNPYGY